MPDKHLKQNNRAAWLKRQLTTENQRLTPSNRDQKFKAMSLSPLTFFRGTDSIFWLDLANDPRLQTFGSSQTQLWIQGDLHAYNFGTFHNSKGQIVYNLNDFDEALPADYQLDLWRLATSILLITKANNQLSSEPTPPFSKDDEDAIIEALALGYLETLLTHQGQDAALLPPFTRTQASGKLEDLLAKVEQKKSRQKMLETWTRQHNGKQLLKEESDYTKEIKLQKLDHSTETTLRTLLERHLKTLPPNETSSPSTLSVKSIRRRLLAGTGSLGIPRYYALVGNEHPQEDLILDLKLQDAPAGLTCLDKDTQKLLNQQFENHAQRVVYATKAMDANVDPMLSSLTLPEGAFLVRERSPYKDDLDTEKLDSPKRFKKVAQQWGLILATAHLRACQTLHCDTSPFLTELNRLTKGRQSEFHTQLSTVASQYAAQVEEDFQTFCKELHL